MPSAAEAGLIFASVMARLKPCPDEKRKLPHRRLASSDEVNNLVGIAGLNESSLPACARQNVAVAFNRDALRRNSETCEKLGDVQPVGNFARLAINYNLNRHLHGRCSGRGSGFRFRRRWFRLGTQ